jgi:predicted metal-dependent HD superfamily phosphohydrolase
VVQDRWRATWKGLGIENADEPLYENVVARYSEPHRHYHTLQHLGECFVRLDEARHLAQHIHEVELALWFHDAVYDTHRQDNEEQSASLAEAAVQRAGLPDSVGQRVRGLILATKHDAAPDNPDAALLVDVDLTILGASVERFDDYERQVRQEYRASHEAAARANLARSIDLLQ